MVKYQIIFYFDDYIIILSNLFCSKICYVHIIPTIYKFVRNIFENNPKINYSKYNEKWAPKCPLSLDWVIYLIFFWSLMAEIVEKATYRTILF